MNGEYYLIVVDIFSKWPEAMKCKTSTCSGTIRLLHELYAWFVISDTILSDNGTQFSARVQRFLEILFDCTPIYRTISSVN